MGFNKLTVVKRLRDESLVQMFLDEARLAARLNHPNIVHTYEIGESGGQFFIAMEYLEGQSISQLVGKLVEAGEGLREPLVAHIASLALKGLHHAHELCDFDGTPLGVVHRDISPQNLFVTYSGEVKLLDFGIAKAAVNSTQTDTGVLKGKIRYMAPEQVAGGSVDRRLDIFAFGIVMWELLARRPLFEGDAISILTRVTSKPLPSVQTVRADVSPELDAIVQRALRSNPDERYPSADAMRAEIDEFLRGHDPAALEKELSRMMSQLFAETRNGVRARIQKFLAKAATVEELHGEPSLSQSGELPALLADSGALAKPTTNATTLGNVLPVSVHKPVERRLAVLLSLVVLVALAVGVGASLLARPRSVAPPVVVSAPSPPVAHVRVETVPPGALVEWNGHPIDRTPADVALDPGPQTLVVSRDGYETVMLKVEPKAGDKLVRTLELKEASTAPSSPASSAVPAASQASGLPSRGTAARPVRAVTGAASATAAPPASATPSATTARPRIKVLDDSP